MTVYRAHEHPTATGPTAGHATTITDTLGPPTPSPRGSGATQTSTSAWACCTRTSEVEIGRRRSRDTHEAATQNKLQPAGSRPRAPSPIIYRACTRRCMTRSCHFSAAASARRAHRCEHVDHDQNVHGCMPGRPCAGQRHQVRTWHAKRASARAASNDAAAGSWSSLALANAGAAHGPRSSWICMGPSFGTAERRGPVPNHIAVGVTCEPEAGFEPSHAVCSIFRKSKPLPIRNAYLALQRVSGATCLEVRHEVRA